MRKLLQKLSILAFVLGLLSTFSFGQIATPPVIDGDGSDAVWATVDTWQLQRWHDMSGVTDEADFSASVKLMWDMDSLYLLLMVMDDSLKNEGGNVWERDHYSIYFDFANLKTTSFVTDLAEPLDSVQDMLGDQNWGRGNDLAISFGLLDTALINGVNFVEAIDNHVMYTLEMSLPLNLYGVSLAADDVIGFDVKVGDNDGDGLDGKVSLYQAQDQGWQNPSYYGTVQLMADGSFSRVPVLPVIDGAWDPAWNVAPTYSLAVENTTTGITGASDFSGTIRVMHNLDSLFLMLEVTDDSLVNTGGNVWERDHYSIYFDFANLKTSTMVVDLAAPMDSVQDLLGDKVWGDGGDLGISFGLLDTALLHNVNFVEVVDTGSMYTMEMALPLNLYGVTLNEGDIIGFDTKIGDNDHGVLDGKYSWHQRLDEGWRNPGYYGNLEMMPILVDLGATQAAPPQIEIDGMMDGDFNQAILMNIERQNTYTGVESTDDFSGSYRALWDEEAIYLWVEVLDDILNAEGGNPWERDHYSLYFDFGNLKTTTYVEDLAEPMDSVQFMLGDKRWSVEGDLGMEDTSLVWGTDFMEVVDTGTVYHLEMKIPMDILGVELSADQDIGFDIKIGDNDGDGLDGKLSWNQWEDQGWQNPSYLGTLTLMTNGTLVGSPVEVNNAPEIEAIDDITVEAGMTSDVTVMATDADDDALTITAVSGDEGIATVSMTDNMITVEGIARGTVTITVTADDGEATAEVTFSVEVTSDVGIDNTSAGFSMYPNPAANVLNISSDNQITSIRVSNLSGQLMFEVPVNATESRLDIRSLDKGMYILSVQFNSERITNRVFVKQ